MINTEKKSAIKPIFTDCMRVGIIATGALCLGLLVNQFRDKPLGLVYQSKKQRLEHAVSKVGTQTQPTQTVSTGNSNDELKPANEIKFIELDEFKALAESGNHLILDARPEIFHRLGHIPKALALPRDDFETYYEKHRSLMESNKNQMLLIYCNGSHCEDSELLTTALQKLGYTNLVIFRGGWNDWEKANLPSETL